MRRIEKGREEARWRIGREGNGDGRGARVRASDEAKGGEGSLAMQVGEIRRRLEEIEAEEGVRIVYACESGSRAWGFASPDSDYDVRFLYVRGERSYGSLRQAADTIERPVDGDFDAGGWDVRKAAALLGVSNGALVEWLHSPLVYHAVPGFLDRWREVARRVFGPKASANHYRGLAKQMVHGKLVGDAVRAKDYLYALRALLCAQWVLEGRGIPPVRFEELLELMPPAVGAAIPGLLDHKASTGEGQKMERWPMIDGWIEEGLDRLDGALAELPKVHPDVDGLDRLWRGEVRRSGPKLRAVDFTLQRIRQPDCLFFDAVAGSRAYGTAIERSDEDRRGVFVVPAGFLGGLEKIERVADERNDQTYEELGRWFELLLKNNPHALELLGMPEDCVRWKHPLFDRVKPEDFLSKRCATTFGEYAMAQVRKARGLNKKIVNPQPEIRQSLLHFCRILEGQGSVPVEDWLKARSWRQEECGLTAIRGAVGLYALYHDGGSEGKGLRGLISAKDPGALVTSSVARNERPVAWLSVHHDAFQAHCKAHREYWEWVELRNEERYATNAQHGRGYDSKNLLHTLRLLDMAEEIARDRVIQVRRPNRDFLLKVRAGEFEYEDLVARAEDKLESVKAAFAASALPHFPDRDAASELLQELRSEFD
ncbi:DNA polymerase beta superfamily protein [Haloferula luteola]|nr:nucleotidyltransferase domain-containing protein [Haloferula luteola]